MAVIKTNLVSSSSPPLWNVYPNKQKTSACVVRTSFRLKDLHRKASLKLHSAVSFNSDLYGNRVLKQNQRNSRKANSSRIPVKAQIGLKFKNAVKWWEKGLQPNMREITSARDLVDSLLNTGDKLVIVDFFSPGCGGCKALHPKICQIAEMNPDVQFLQVNYEEHKSMCYSLNVHVLPFFRFYRGAQGRVCSFSCTNATIKKFKDALAKHAPDRCSIGPTKGLEDKELAALANNKDLNFIITPKSDQPISVPAVEERIPSHWNPSPHMKPVQGSVEKILITSGR